MQPVRISSNIKYVWNTVLLLIGMVFLYLAYWIISREHTSNDALIEFFILGVVLTTLAIYFLLNAKTILFDDRFLYIKGRKQSDQIPLSKIVKVKLTMASVKNVHFWKVSYHDNDGLIKSRRFVPRVFSRSFRQFLETVKHANPLAAIQYFSHSFDFDQ